ncbi:TadE/TadG family type IV pilus assembly protein [Thalassorhabdomicrobium marinisediminis]|uniref:TadE/TadG family type IV pilus assembly protein n=1 Tax=Thalassorhabdomicrobium marinisediminis TaxID=2170577 RepID=UPI002491BA0B|nr:TadE family protein [Thalassorhabdomicrobium marinisediminis]
MRQNGQIYRATQAWHAFKKDDAGSATIESVLWQPLFVMFFVLIADVSFVFHRQTHILTVLQDGNRALSVGRLASLDELKDFVRERISYLSDNTEIDSVISSGVVTTQVQVPVHDLVAVGMFDFLANYNINVGSQHFIEY